MEVVLERLQFSEERAIRSAGVVGNRVVGAEAADLAEEDARMVVLTLHFADEVTERRAVAHAPVRERLDPGEHDVFLRREVRLELGRDLGEECGDLDQLGVGSAVDASHLLGERPEHRGRLADVAVVLVDDVVGQEARRPGRDPGQRRGPVDSGRRQSPLDLAEVGAFGPACGLQRNASAAAKVDPEPFEDGAAAGVFGDEVANGLGGKGLDVHGARGADDCSRDWGQSGPN